MSIILNSKYDKDTKRRKYFMLHIQNKFCNIFSGQYGYTIDDETANGIPSIRPYTGWALLLPKDSKFR